MISPTWEINRTVFADAQDVDEQSLVFAAQHKDSQAFNHLAHRYQSQVYNIAYRLLGESQSAADAAQEAFLSAFRAIGQYNGRSFKSWIMRIVCNECYDRLRYRRRHPEESLEHLVGELDLDHSLLLEAKQELPEGRVLRQELFEAIQRGLLELPADQRTAIVMADILDYDYVTIAEITGTALGTLKSRISRGRIRLRYLLSVQGHRRSATDSLRAPADRTRGMRRRFAGVVQER